MAGICSTFGDAASIERTVGISRQVQEVTEIMNGSINELLASQDDLQVLEDKTDALASQAQRFQRNAHSLQRNQWWKNCKLKVAMCGALLAIITMVALPLALQATHIAADGSGTTTIVLGGTTSRPPAAPKMSSAPGFPPV